MERKQQSQTVAVWGQAFLAFSAFISQIECQSMLLNPPAGPSDGRCCGSGGAQPQEGPGGRPAAASLPGIGRIQVRPESCSFFGIGEKLLIKSREEEEEDCC